MFLRLYYLDYYLMTEVVLFILKNYSVSKFLLLTFLFWSPTLLVSRAI